MSDHTSEQASNLGKVLQGLLNDAHQEEVIGDVSIADVLQHVDLNIAFSPVVSNRVCDSRPRPDQLQVHTLLKRDDGRYEMRYRTDIGMTFDLLDTEEVRVMRARWILCRNYFAESIEHYSHPDQQQIIADFFPQGLWRPA